MSTNRKEIVFSEILKLSPIERIEIVEKILTSFELPERKEIDNLWSIEVENRIDAYEAGKIKSKSYEEVFEDIE
jgi:putative addiction module component (TIGR02574 family)